MDITVTPYLLKRRKKKNGQIPIYFRISQGGKYSLVSSGIDVESRYWTGKWGKWIKGGRTGHPAAKALNNRLQNKITDINNTIAESGEGVSRVRIAKQVRGKGNGEFFEYAESFYKELHNQGNYHPYKQTKAAVSKLREFAGSNLRFNDITPAFLNDFQHWMKRKLDNHDNTVIKTMGRIKAVMNKAYRDDLTRNLPFQDPKFIPIKTVETKKEALSIDQIEALAGPNLTEGSELWHTRNYFMFSFWNAGIRFTDLAFLRWKNIIDGRLVYQMGKTSSKKNIHLLPQALKILEYYHKQRDESLKDLEEKTEQEIETIKNEMFVFPILPKQELTELGYRKKAASQNTVVNRNLKEIQHMAGIQTNLAFHISRHSFARWADGSGVMDRRAIMNALAHSKMATTERYLESFSEYNLDEGMKKLAESRGGPKKNS